MTIIQVITKRILVVEIGRIRQKVLPLYMAFLVGVITVVKIIALKIEFGSNDIIVIQSTTPCSVDATVAVAAIYTHCCSVITRYVYIDITTAAFLHSCQLTGEVENIHKRKSFSIGVVTHTNRRKLPCPFK